MTKENKYKNEKNWKKRVVVSIFLILLFLILIFLVKSWMTLEIDNHIYYSIMQSYSPSTTSIFRFFTNVWGTYWVIWITILLVSFLTYKKWFWKYTIILTITPIIIYILNTVIKNIIQRPRPEILRLIDETGYSFPSGHTMQALAFYWLIIIITNKFIDNKVLKYLINIISIIMIVWIAISRIYLWVHYFSDIVWWIILSLIYLIIIKYFIDNKKVA